MNATGSQLLQMALFKWLDIIGVVLFVGSIAFRQLVFFPSLQSIHEQKIRSRMLEENETQSRRLQWFLLLYLCFLHFLALVHKVKVISEFHVGFIWWMKLLLLVALIFLVRSRMQWNGDIFLGFASLLCLMGSLGGHALEQEYNIIVLTDWLHFTAVSVWAGGLLPLMKTARQGRQCLIGSDLASFLSKILEDFSIWATLCVITIIATGSFNAMIYLGSKGLTLVPLYEKVLALKLSFVLAAFALGGFSRFYILPRLKRIPQSASTEAAALERLIYRMVTIELGIVVTVLVLAAFLTQTPQPGVGMKSF